MDKKDLDEILLTMLNSFGSDVSDLNFTCFKPLQVEHEGSLTGVRISPPLALGYLSPYQSSQIAMGLIGSDARVGKDLSVSGSCDLAYQVRSAARFRVNIFCSKKNHSIVLRKLQTVIPTLDDIKAPSSFRKVIEEKNGLILVTGATGSGKSTTLAAMLREINATQSIHVVTLEDPIEFVHNSIKATFNQREQGIDFDNFPNGLRAALRQAPKIILVGEMRDRSTMEIGLTAAETGHLVLSTLHTVDAGQTINRIVGMFDKEQEEQIRTRLAETLRWVICQRLLRKEGGGRVAAHEIMGSNLRTTELIEQGEDEIKTYASVIEAAEPLGWQTFEGCLAKLYQQGLISEKTAMFNTTRKNLLRQRIDYIKSQKGEKTSDLENLKVDEQYIERTKEEIKSFGKKKTIKRLNLITHLHALLVKQNIDF